MFKNYIITAFRSLKKNKGFSLINIFGLIFSMAICLLVITIIVNVNKSDDFHTNKNRIYRVLTLHSDRYIMNEEFATSPFPLLQAIKTELPQVENGVHLRRLNGNASLDSKVIKFEGLYTNPDFFKSFSFKLKQGDIKNLDEPFKIFITEKFANKLFEDKPAIGKSIYINNLGLFEVKGIIKNPSQPSHLRFEVIASSATLLSLEKQDKVYKFSENWTNIWENASYIMVKPNTNITELEASINILAKDNYTDKKYFKPRFFLQPLTSISPGKALNNEIGFVIPHAALFGLSFIAILILSITGFNYLNLSLAKSISKSKEIGIRKVLGSGRKHIVFQYIAESIIILIASFILSSILFEYIFKFLTQFEPAISNELALERSYSVYIVFFIFTILIGIIFGLITSFNISKSNPIKVLKDVGNSKIITRFALRKILITAQFVVSATFIILTVLAFKQFSSIVDKDLGFDKENLITIKLQDVSHEVLANEIKNSTNISDISSVSMMPVSFGTMKTEAILPNSPDTTLINMLNVNYNFIDLMNIDLVAGRNYTLNDGIGNERYVIVNKAATKKMGFLNPSDAIGESINLDGNLVEIIGVTNDFYYSDPMSKIDELLIRYLPDQFKTLIIKHNENADIKSLTSELKKKWEEINPNVSLSYEIYEESIERMFKPLTFAGVIIGILSILAISISCLGLLGMVAYNSESSKKEIGIRKVMGATPGIIIKYLSKSYFTMVSIALLISALIIGLVTIAIKQQLPNSIGFDIPSVLLGILIIICISIVTILSQTYSAARRNPVDALRYE
jgi:putative ABC transport system permease protein